jgi:hypothetical protein
MFTYKNPLLVEILPSFQLAEVKAQQTIMDAYWARYRACGGLCSCGRPVGWLNMDLTCHICHHDNPPTKLG